MVTSSSIIRPGPAPSKGGQEITRNKNLRIAPLSSVLRKTVATLSDVMNATTLNGPVKPGHGLIFQTLPQKQGLLENKKTQTSNASSSMVGTTPNGVPIPPSSSTLIPSVPGPALQQSRFIKTVQTNAGPIGMDYPMYQACEATIPIYDGRASTGTPFTFTYDDLANLKQRRRYEGGLFDLAHEDLVVVGHTINTFGSAPANNFCYNLQFVILMNSKAQSSS
ncbi:hypothetical protein BDN72DRAFT_907322 [Pluteus cervinus]|uniref:Uncharacterized protein n=1 Tax=Pluteus cervinus TaxID=181527 RepID=A0ACD2ZWM6_9AGAR|nr:hypothetical protein BDN72DRAFT_907322 [Pluteus cervinus]